MKITALVTTTGLLLAGCAVHESNASEVRVDHLPPENLDIIEALVRSGDIPLSVHPLCEELAGPNAKTIGEYTAQLLAMQVEGGTNDVWAGTGDGYVEGFWEADVVYSSGGEDERNHWGVRFLIRKSDGLVMPDSFRCFVPAWD
jgi:hypothetical protein